MLNKLILSLVFFLTACSDPSAVEKKFPILPDGLKDCTFYDIDPGGVGREIHVARCPNSATSMDYQIQQGKTSVTKTTIVIDGIEYIEKDKDVK